VRKAALLLLVAVVALAAAATSWAAGDELCYQQDTANVVVSTTAPTMTDVTTLTGCVVPAAPILIEFFAPIATAPASDVEFRVYEDGNLLGRIAYVGSANSPVYGVLRRTAHTAGTHNYAVKAYRTSANVTVYSGTGTAGTEVPRFLRVSVADPGAAGGTTLDALTNVDTTGKVDGSILEWDTTSSQWEVGTDDVGAGGAGGEVEVTNWPELQAVDVGQNVSDRVEILTRGVWVAVGVLIMLLLAPSFTHAWRFWRE